MRRYVLKFGGVHNTRLVAIDCVNCRSPIKQEKSIMKMTLISLRAFTLAMFAAFILGGCEYTVHPPRIDIEFKPDAPIVSDGKAFVVEENARSDRFSGEDLGEQLAFINQTLAETTIGTIAPKVSNARNRRYSVFVGARMDRYELESIVHRLEVSDLVDSAEVSEYPSRMATP